MQISIEEAKTHLSRFMDQAANGEEIVIARAGKPFVRLVPVEAQPKPPRVPGFAKGEFTIPDDAFAPMTEEELKDWYGD